MTARAIEAFDELQLLGRSNAKAALPYRCRYAIHGLLWPLFTRSHRVPPRCGLLFEHGAFNLGRGPAANHRENTLKISLIASPELGAGDIAVFRAMTSETKRTEYRQLLADRMLEEIISLTEPSGGQKVRALILAWLIANDRLEVRFAFPSHIESAGIFHEKIGVFDFPSKRPSRVYRLSQRDFRRASAELQIYRRLSEFDSWRRSACRNQAQAVRRGLERRCC